MKKECLICGEAFDCRNQAKTCPVCRTAGKRICGHCGKVFVTTSKTRYVCKDCDAVRAPKSAQVARCGNAVPPPFAEALVRANLPELCGAEERESA